jgi:hypothetical protein
MSVRKCDRLLGIVSAYAAKFHLAQEILDPCLIWSNNRRSWTGALIVGTVVHVREA